MKWVGRGYEKPQRWGLKKDMPKELRPMAVKVAFRFETVYIARNHAGDVLMPGHGGGGWLQTFDFHLNTPGHVIGPRDASAADNETWAREWRHACVDRRAELMKAIQEHGPLQ